jgi:hypothetical protein
MSDLDAAEIAADKLTCEICGYVASEPKVLGSHKRFKHGIAGTSHSAELRAVAKKKGRRRGSGTLIEAVLGYLDAYRGPHHTEDIATELGLRTDQVKNAISKAKISGEPIGSDGSGNWRWTGDLKVRASSRPTKTTISRELVPVETTTNGNGHKERTFTAVDKTDIELLDDGDGGLWLATRIK